MKPNNEQHREGQVAKAIENQTAKIPSDIFLWAAFGSMAISLTLKIDTNFCPIMEYFEIFTERMVFCRKAAQFLGYDFGLVINNFKLL